MQKFIEYILNQIVAKPESLKVVESNQNGFFVYQIEVDQDDMGLVIGKGGKTINSIRSLVRAKAIKDGIRVRIELLDKETKNSEEA